MTSGSEQGTRGNDRAGSDARREVDALQDDSARVIDAGRQLRDLSKRILEEIDGLRRLESESRRLPVGSPEFERLSREIADRARQIFGMAGEQRVLAEEALPDDRTLEDLDREDAT
jgi:hypothetical protein